MSKWKEIPQKEAENNPLYGIGGWLAVFSILLPLGLLRELAETQKLARTYEISVGTLLTADHDLSHFLLLNLILHLGILVSIYYLLFTKSRNFRVASTCIVLSYYPIVIIGLAIFPVEGLPREIIPALIGAFCVTCVWIAYLQLSKRVRVTFEHKIHAKPDTANTPSIPSKSTAKDDALPAAQQTSSPLNANAIGQAPTMLPAAPAIQPIKTPQATPIDSMPSDAPYIELNDDATWALLLAEVEGSGRRNGVWAKMYAENGGVDSATKAAYLKTRYEQVQQARIEREKKLQEEHLQELRLNEELQQRLRLEQIENERRIKEEEEKIAQQLYEAAPKGACPNCDTVQLLTSSMCQKCQAIFEEGAAWKLKPIDPHARQLTSGVFQRRR